jgi:hypothetical protein
LSFAMFGILLVTQPAESQVAPDERVSQYSFRSVSHRFPL